MVVVGPATTTTTTTATLVDRWPFRPRAEQQPPRVGGDGGRAEHDDTEGGGRGG